MIYLDNAATSHPKPPAVPAAIQSFLVDVGANPGRSAHRLSAEAARIVFEAREGIARLLGVTDSRHVVFTANATHAINVVLHGLLGAGDHVVTTSMEHNSVTRPLRGLARDRGIEVTVVRADRTGVVDPAAVGAALTSRTRLVVVNHASNVVGTVQGLARIKEAIGKVPILVDAAQTAGCHPIDVEKDGIDLLAFTGHKSLLGPQGTGGFYVRPGLEIPPLVRGGTGSRSESDEQPEFLPDRHEAGTMNACGIAGLGAGVRFVLDQGIDGLRSSEMEVFARLVEGLRGIDRLEIHGPETIEDRLPTVSFNVGGRSPSDVGRELDRRHEILVRAGLHCAPEAHRTIGTFPRGSVRLSVGILNTADEMERVVEAVKEIARG